MKTLGDSIVLACAATLLQCSIVIVSATHNKPYMISPPTDVCTNIILPQVYVGHVKDHHFVALQPTSGYDLMESIELIVEFFTAGGETPLTES